jgi:hypothetical protein
LLGQLELNTVVFFGSARAVDSNEAGDYIRDSWPFTAPRGFDLSLDGLDVVWMAVLNFVLKPTNCFRISKSLAGPVKIEPTKLESALRCSEASAKDVVESAEITPPPGSGNDTDRNLLQKPFRVSKREPSISIMGFSIRH